MRPTDNGPEQTSIGYTSNKFPPVQTLQGAKFMRPKMHEAKKLRPKMDEAIAMRPKMDEAIAMRPKMYEAIAMRPKMHEAIALRPKKNEAKKFLRPNYITTEISSDANRLQ